MNNIKTLFENNRAWASKMTAQDPDFFKKLVRQQSPNVLWIGCSDSRVPANEIVGLQPGELFVHRNVANLVIHSDMNCLSVLQFAVDVLKVEHIIVCGHYGCGGVKASIEEKRHGLIDNWLRPIKDLYQIHLQELNAIKNVDATVNRLCELNVEAQVFNVANTTIVQEAWLRSQLLTVHGWIYNIADGLLKDLGFSLTNTGKISRSEERDKGN